MRQSQELANELIFSLYQAAQDREQLPAFLSGIANAFDSTVIGLRGHDAGWKSQHYFECISFPAREWMSLEQQFVETGNHPWRRQGYSDMLKNGVGQSHTILPDNDLRKTDFYHGVLKPMDLGYGMGLCLWAKPPTELVAISINRPAKIGRYSEQDLRFAQSLIPHFRSAYAIMRRISWAESKAQSLTSAFDRLDIGLVIVDAHAKCSYRNSKADMALHNRGGISLSVGNSLRCASADNQNKLLDALRNAQRGLLRQPVHIHVRDASGALQYVLVVAMLHSDLVSGAAGDGACATVFIHERSAVVAQPQTVLREAYRLTAAEARLAALLATDLSPKECAATLGISMPTIRSQLQCLFAKTSTQRQSELVMALNFALRAM